MRGHLAFVFKSKGGFCEEQVLLLVQFLGFVLLSQSLANLELEAMLDVLSERGLLVG